MDARRGLEAAELAEGKAQAELTAREQALKNAEQGLGTAKTDLEAETVLLRTARQEVNEQLHKMAEDSLEIEEQSAAVFQGGHVTFTAKSRYELDTDLVDLHWETAGVPIIGRSDLYHVTIDTSSVGPGDYDIRVSLVLKRA